MTIKCSNNVGRLMECAIANYITHLTDMYCQEEDPDKKDRLEECIYELEEVQSQIGRCIS